MPLPAAPVAPASQHGASLIPTGLKLSELRAGRLAAYAYAVLPPANPGREALLEDYAAAVLAHARTRRELVPLLRAWSEAGIQVLLFKGFALSEFVYPARGVRAYADVDILLHDEDVPRALPIARALGWWDSRSLDRDVHFSHTAFVLESPNGTTQIDAHRWILQSALPWNRTQRRITRSVWENSSERTLEGVVVRIPSAEDSAVVGLILQRCWGDRWHFRPEHLLDLRVLQEIGGVSPAKIEARGRELRCSRTVEAFRREHGWEPRPEAAASPSDEVRRSRRRALLRERADLVLGPWFVKAQLLIRVVPAVPAVLRAMGVLRRVLRLLRGTNDPGALLPHLEPAHPPSAGGGEVHWHENEIRWAMGLMRAPAQGWGTIRILTLFTILRSRGWPVVFRMAGGVFQAGERLPAWIELDGRVLAASGNLSGHHRNQPAFTYPAPAHVSHGGGERLDP